MTQQQIAQFQWNFWSSFTENFGNGTYIRIPWNMFFVFLMQLMYDDVWRLTKQPKLTAIIQSCRLTLFGHIMRIDDNADAKRILLASPSRLRRQPDRPRITWLSTVQQDLKQHHLTLPEAADLAQNRPLWRMMSTYGATQSWVACQKRRQQQQWQVNNVTAF